MGFSLLATILFLVTPMVAPPAAAEAIVVDELYSREEFVKMAGYGEDKLSTVKIEGRLVCQTCSDRGDEGYQMYPISGASVAFFCSISDRIRPPWAKSTTDEHGNFLIDLPSHLHAIPNLENICVVKVLELPKGSICSQDNFIAKHKGIELITVEEGIRTYTTHSILVTQKSCNNNQEIINIVWSWLRD